MRVSRFLGLLAVFAVVGFAQRLDPVAWSLTAKPAAAQPGAKVLARLTATIEPGWHLYGLGTPSPSQPTKVKLTGTALADTIAIYQTEPKRAFDNNFNIETQTYEGKADFLLQGAVKPDAPAGA